MKFSISEWIDAPPAEVFAVASDLEGAGAWMHNLVRIEMLTGGGFREGARWREVRKMYGKEAFEEFEVRSLDAPGAFTIHVDGSKGTTGRGEYLFEHRLVADNGGTRFEMEGIVTGMGIMGTLLGPIMKGAFRKAMLKDIRAMKAHIESAPTGT